MKPFIEKERKLFFTSKKQAKSRIVLTLINVSKIYSRKVFSSVNLSLKRGDRMTVIGSNGSGKTTLLKTIVGLETPSKGAIYIPTSVRWTFYSQEHENLNFNNTIIDEVIGIKTNIQTMARTILGSLGIEKDMVFKRIDTLSIGERNKVALAKTILSGANLLILDEPTNHLEITAREAVEDALARFDGTIIFVSHDRMFLKKLAKSTYNIENNKYYEGNYKVIIAKSGNKIIGFINAISDGILSAYIPLLEVLPDFQSQGIEKELVIKMKENLKDFYMIDLMCDDKLVPYYEKFGMLKSCGVYHRNYEKQSGNCH